MPFSESFSFSFALSCTCRRRRRLSHHQPPTATSAAVQRQEQHAVQGRRLQHCNAGQHFPPPSPKLVAHMHATSQFQCQARSRCSPIAPRPPTTAPTITPVLELPPPWGGTSTVEHLTPQARHLSYGVVAQATSSTNHFKAALPATLPPRLGALLRCLPLPTPPSFPLRLMYPATSGPI